LKAKKDGFPKRGASPFYLVFTDLDGTLLDHDTYEWDAAVPALRACRRRGTPVILVSSKTRSEMDILRRALSLSDPFVSENGGGLFFPKETFVDPPPGSVPLTDPAGETGFSKGAWAPKVGGLWKLSLGVPYPRLICALDEIRHELGWDIRGFSDMGLEEISRLTGLGAEEARRAAMREYDEPFIIHGNPLMEMRFLYRAAEKRGLMITSGGRFYHLQGKNDKAQAMETIAACYRKTHTAARVIALGDSPNDFSMLERADIPVLIRSRRNYSDLKRRIPRLRISDQVGPEGWNSVVLSILSQNGESVHE